MKTTQNVKTHISLYVKDVNETVKFYSRLFGEGPAKHYPDYAKYELENPGLVISFIQKSPEKAGLAHFGIRWDAGDKFKEERARLVENEMAERIEDNTQCCYAFQDKVWVKDPDGHAWEVYRLLSDAEKAEATPASSCC